MRLKKPLPVILSYWTAEVDAHGLMHFREDIYGQDGPVLAALDGPGGGLRLYRPAESAPATPKDLVPEAEAKDWIAEAARDGNGRSERPPGAGG